MLQWLFFEACHLNVHCGAVWWTEKIAPVVGAPGLNPGTAEHAAWSARHALDLLEGHLDGRRFAVGEGMTLVDCAILPAVTVIDGASRGDPERWPRITEYRARLCSRPSWTAAMGDAVLAF